MSITASVVVTDGAGRNRAPITVDVDPTADDAEVRGGIKAAAKSIADRLGCVPYDWPGERVRVGRLTVTDDSTGDVVSLNLWRAQS